MKGFGFLFMLFLMAAACIHLACSINGVGSTTLNQDGVSIERMKLKGKNEDDRVGLEDYRPIDPVPSSTSSIRPGPIQHGAPLLPYIPEPSPPPTGPKHDGFP